MGKSTWLKKRRSENGISPTNYYNSMDSKAPTYGVSGIRVRTGLGL